MTRWTAIPLLVLAILAAGCAGLPAGTYFPTPGDPNTRRVATVLHRAAVAAGDDPARYTFALINSQHPAAFTDEDATFYISLCTAYIAAAILVAGLAGLSAILPVRFEPDQAETKQ